MNVEAVKAWVVATAAVACIAVGLLRDEIPLVNAGLGVMAGPQLLKLAVVRGNTRIEVNQES